MFLEFLSNLKEIFFKMFKKFSWKCRIRISDT